MYDNLCNKKLRRIKYMYNLDKSTNAVFSLNYHFITVVKYRKKIFTDDDIVNDLKQFVEQISEEY